MDLAPGTQEVSEPLKSDREISVVSALPDVACRPQSLPRARDDAGFVGQANPGKPVFSSQRHEHGLGRLRSLQQSSVEQEGIKKWYCKSQRRYKSIRSIFCSETLEEIMSGLLADPETIEPLVANSQVAT